VARVLVVVIIVQLGLPPLLPFLLRMFLQPSLAHAADVAFLDAPIPAGAVFASGALGRFEDIGHDTIKGIAPAQQ
jgi:hypothetical protein